MTFESHSAGPARVDSEAGGGPAARNADTGDDGCNFKLPVTVNRARDRRLASATVTVPRPRPRQSRFSELSQVQSEGSERATDSGVT